MRVILTALAAGAALALLSPSDVRAFDAEACERFRALNNEDLAATMRAAESARTKDRECFVRIAMLRLGMLGEDEFSVVPTDIIHRLVGRDFATSADDPLPAHVLRRYAEDLAEAEAAAHVDPIARRSLDFQPIDEEALTGWVPLPQGPQQDGSAVASTAGALADPATAEQGADAIPEGADAAVASLPPGSAEPAVPEAPWRADADLGILGEAVHLPRNTPPPHPRAAERRAAVPVVEERAAAAPVAQGPAEPGGCLPAAAVRDPDLGRNRATIERHGLCLGLDRVREGAIEFVFTTVSNPHAPDGPVWYLPHDNEQEAFDAAVYAVAVYGGRMVAVNGDDTRFYRSVDPNRYFAMTAADARPCAIRRPTPAYTAYVMGQFAGQREVLSIHNNTRGGGVTVNVWDDKSRGYPVKAGRYRDPDHLVYIAGDRPIDDDAESLARRDRLNNAGLNVVHERVTRGNSDCSFSNHVVLNDGRPYYNIEAVHGSDRQRGMVDVLMGILGYRKVAGG